ncbi:uncharacterized protein LOC120251190 [Dioscorea cayenensis subsp. rotundata]|uniref:Uncharacterized protein LOC120251190 n=1 Tax=Dioscorea cayennensis subsp. rotundata TaxID=55577 RepID=A0AB40ALI5_DIOCR|nr:uncharacterized protein LOC120251190 [Dioscorea cayenensis subsp. rotundata]
MEPYIFQALVDRLREKSLLCNSKRTTVEEQLAMFMYTLAHNASNRDVQERFQHSAKTVSRYFSKVLKAVNRLAREYIEPPSTLTSQVIQNTRKFFPYFKLVGKVLLPTLGFSNVRLNKNHVERIIGILKMRFPILKVATFHPIDSQTDIVVAACMLHNFIHIHNGTDAVEDFDNEANETIVPNGDESYGEDIDTMNSELTAGARKKDEIAMQMWNDYCSYRRA